MAVVLNYPYQEGYVFGFFGWCLAYYLKSNERMCMKLQTEVCLRPRNNRLDFGGILITIRIRIDDENFTRCVSRAKDKSIKF